MGTKPETDFIQDTIRISNKDIPVKVGLIEQAALRFYPENPRIYSIVGADTGEPSQEEVQKKLQDMDHVKGLYQSIKANGGLTDPLLVRDGDFVVLEGNSRLAAYRLLAKGDPVRWGKVKCQILPKDIPDREIFTLLGEYHIIGKKDWAPFEQAGYMYRRCERHAVSPETVAREIGLSAEKVCKDVEVYKFMLEHEESDITRWSYYYEYLSHRPLQKARKQYPELDKLVVRKIRDNEIAKAVDVREKLNIIAKSEKALKAFVSGKKDFEHAYESAQSRGAGDAWYSRLNKFRTHIADLDFVENLKDMQQPVRDKCIFELRKIGKLCESILKKFDRDRGKEV